MNKINKSITLFIYNNFNKNKMISKLFIIISKYSSYIFFLIYLFTFLSLFYEDTKLEVILRYIFIPFLALLTNIMMRKTFKVKRPELTLEIKPKYSHKLNYCFPSNHSTCSVIICFCLKSFSFNLFIILYLFSILVSLSRIVVGFHYFFDVLFGVIIGTIFGNII